VAWGGDDTLVYAPSFAGALMRVSASGGEPQPATRLDLAQSEGTHRVPQFLPDGRTFLFYSSGGTGTEPGKLCIGRLGSLDHRCLTAASSGGVVPPHYVVYSRGKTLVAQRLDLDSMELSGEAAPLEVDLPSNLGTSGQRALSGIGYRGLPGGLDGAQSSRLGGPGWR